jgi:hypothetical protein
LQNLALSLQRAFVVVAEVNLLSWVLDTARRVWARVSRPITCYRSFAASRQV